jgi:hypothetical protein
MFRGVIRILVSASLIWIGPASLIAADAGAVLYGKGVVLRNNTEIGTSAAIFPGDLIETKSDSTGNLNSLGTSVIILPNSLVEFEGQSLSVEHGSVSVGTSHGISVRVGCITIVPVSSAWTQFEVTDVNGTVHVAAKKNDVRLETQTKLESTKETSSHKSGDLREGEQTTRDESDGCKGGKKDAATPPAGTGGILSSQYVKDGAIAAIGGLGLYLLLQPDDAASPWKP